MTTKKVIRFLGQENEPTSHRTILDPPLYRINLMLLPTFVTNINENTEEGEREKKTEDDKDVAELH